MRAIVAALLLAVLSPAVAHATSIAPLTVEQMTDASTYIVRGKIVRTWTEQDENARVWTKAELAVTKVLKGPDEPATLVVTALGGQFGEQITRVDGMARFSAEEEIFVFLDDIHGGRDLTPVGAYTGKFTVKRPPHEERKIAVAYEVNPDTRFDARFLPVPPREQWLYVEDLEQVVKERLVTGWDGREIPGVSREELELVNRPERRIH